MQKQIIKKLGRSFRLYPKQIRNILKKYKKIQVWIDICYRKEFEGKK